MGKTIPRATTIPGSLTANLPDLHADDFFCFLRFIHATHYPSTLEWKGTRHIWGCVDHLRRVRRSDHAYPHELPRVEFGIARGECTK